MSDCIKVTQNKVAIYQRTYKLKGFLLNNMNSHAGTCKQCRYLMETKEQNAKPLSSTITKKANIAS